MCPGSHHHVHDDENEKEFQMKNDKVEPFVLKQFAVLVGNEYVQRTSIEYLGHHNPCYNSLAVSDETKLPNALEFGSGGGPPIADLLEINQNTHSISASTEALKALES